MMDMRIVTTSTVRAACQMADGPGVARHHDEIPKLTQPDIEVGEPCEVLERSNLSNDQTKEGEEDVQCDKAELVIDDSPVSGKVRRISEDIQPNPP